MVIHVDLMQHPDVCVLILVAVKLPSHAQRFHSNEA
jgi:hypothetical protein